MPLSVGQVTFGLITCPAGQMPAVT